MAWRKREKIDTLILQPHPYYREIKKCYPHFYCGTDLSNEQICYYERPGYLELKRLEEIGVPTMVWHYNFQTEFCWTYMSTNGEETRTLSGIDVDNVGLYDVKGVVKEFLQAISKISQEHYPERAGKICVLNAPSWFSMLWNVIKLTLHPNTQKKVRVCEERSDELKRRVYWVSRILTLLLPNSSLFSNVTNVHSIATRFARRRARVSLPRK